MNASVIVDIGFGDSGKGRLVDALCADSDRPFVIRYTGGSQAGHTVVNDKGRHVHSSFPSGTLSGYPGFMSRFCPIHLSNLLEEHAVLLDLGVEPTLFIDPLAPLITPYDVTWGRLMEKKTNHGSCGMGIGAAMWRQEFSPYKLYVGDLLHRGMLASKVSRIGHWYRARAMSDGLEWPNEVTDEERDFIQAKEQRLPFEISTIYDAFAALDYEPDHLILEGAQGVMLDRDHGAFPHVTFGHTTKRNAELILDGAELSGGANLYYVTRCYQTRHGAGPMSAGEGKLELVGNEEETNTNNEWQRDFRVGALDYDLMNYAMAIDRSYDRHRYRNTILNVTCLDHRPGFKMDYDQLPKFNSVIETRSART